ncbi:MAG: alpha/beta hydrolase family protein [Pseudomonadales bacterium]
MLKKIVLGLALLVVAGIIYINYGRQPPAIDPASVSYKMLQPGPYEVRREQLEVTDDSRPTPANGDYAGSDSRSFAVFIWSPKPGSVTAPQPLLIYSHGFMSTGEGGSYLAEHLASHGYVVAAPSFPLTNYDAPGKPNVKDVVNQPADVKFVIDRVLQWNADPQHRLHQTIDAARIATAGLSLGGMTTTLVAYHPTLSDTRLKAAISIAGPSAMFSRAFFQRRSLPFMMVAAPEDAMVAYADHAADISSKVDNAILTTIAGGSHTGFSSMAKWLRWTDNPDQIACDQLMQNIDLEEEAPWFDLLGTPEQGIVEIDASSMCATSPLPKAINPLRQQQLNTLAVFGFLQCKLATKPVERKRYCRFLLEQLPREMAEVSVTGG